MSFTHLLGYAMVQALKLVPDMNNSYKVVNGKPTLVIPNQVNLGLAIDLKEADGSRRLLVPNITGADQLNFREFWQAYEAMVKKARTNTLTVDDFAGTTASLTNPGGIGTSHSVPRLMPGQGVILGVGSLDYPPEFQAASDQRLRELAVSKITTLTSTYDHRVIQGATSGEFLKVMHDLILGKHGFYDEVFLFVARALPAPALGLRRLGSPDVRTVQGRPRGAVDQRVPDVGPPDGRHRSAGVRAAHAPGTRTRGPRSDHLGS